MDARTNNATPAHHHHPSKGPDMERRSRHAQTEAKQIKPFDSRVGIEVVSYRTRLCDADGVSAKAIIDGIVHCGVLQDDSAEWVSEVKYSQVKVKNQSEEKTVVIISEVE